MQLLAGRGWLPGRRDPYAQTRHPVQRALPRRDQADFMVLVLYAARG